MPTPQQIDAAIKLVARRFDGFGGNCARFAAVLNRMLEGGGDYVIAPGEHYEYVDHVLLKFEDNLYDAGGLTTAEKAREKWCDEGKDLEDYHDPSMSGISVRRLADDSGAMSASWDEDELVAALHTAIEAVGAERVATSHPTS